MLIGKRKQRQLSTHTRAGSSTSSCIAICSKKLRKPSGWMICSCCNLTDRIVAGTLSKMRVGFGFGVDFGLGPPRKLSNNLLSLIPSAWWAFTELLYLSDMALPQDNSITDGVREVRMKGLVPLGSAGARIRLISTSLFHHKQIFSQKIWAPSEMTRSLFLCLYNVQKNAVFRKRCVCRGCSDIIRRVNFTDILSH